MDFLKGFGIGTLIFVVIIICINVYMRFVKTGLQQGYTQREAEKNAVECVIGLIVIILTILTIIIMTVN